MENAKASNEEMKGGKEVVTDETQTDEKDRKKKPLALGINPKVSYCCCCFFRLIIGNYSSKNCQNFSFKQLDKQCKLCAKSKSADDLPNGLVDGQDRGQSDYLKWKEIESFCADGDSSSDSNSMDSDHSEQGEIQIVRI